jgi:hypothetical protein
MSDFICQCAIVTNNMQLKQQLREVNKMGGFYHSSKQYAKTKLTVHWHIKVRHELPPIVFTFTRCYFSFILFKTYKEWHEWEITHDLLYMSVCHSNKQ